MTTKKYVTTIGQEFNNWTVIKSSGKSGYWLCKCKCGTLREIQQWAFHSGHTKSCGCLFKLGFGKDSVRWKGVGDVTGRLWCNIVSNAKKRNIQINITIDYVWELYQKQNGKCALSGIDIPLSYAKLYPNGATKQLSIASLDRIDSSKGYIKGNVWWVHKDINYMKHIYDLKKFVKYCALVTKHCKKNNIGLE